MQLADLAHRLVVELLGVGRLVEIEITAEYLVGSLARKHHLYSHRLYDARQQIHGRRRPHRRHVVSLDVVYHVAQGVQSLLNRVMYLVMHRAYHVGHPLRRGQIGRALQSYGERVQLRPPRRIAAARLDTLVGILLRHRRKERRT